MSFVCPVCANRFRDHTHLEFAPFMLDPCRHTVCRLCAIDMFRVPVGGSKFARCLICAVPVVKCESNIAFAKLAESEFERDTMASNEGLSSPVLPGGDDAEDAPSSAKRARFANGSVPLTVPEPVGRAASREMLAAKYAAKAVALERAASGVGAGKEALDALCLKATEDVDGTVGVIQALLGEVGNAVVAWGEGSKRRIANSRKCQTKQLDGQADLWKVSAAQLRCAAILLQHPPSMAAPSPLAAGGEDGCVEGVGTHGADSPESGVVSRLCDVDSTMMEPVLQIILDTTTLQSAIAAVSRELASPPRLVETKTEKELLETESIRAAITTWRETGVWGEAAGFRDITHDCASYFRVGAVVDAFLEAAEARTHGWTSPLPPWNGVMGYVTRCLDELPPSSVTSHMAARWCGFVSWFLCACAPIDLARDEGSASLVQDTMGPDFVSQLRGCVSGLTRLRGLMVKHVHSECVQLWGCRLLLGLANTRKRQVLLAVGKCLDLLLAAAHAWPSSLPIRKAALEALRNLQDMALPASAVTTFLAATLDEFAHDVTLQTLVCVVLRRFKTCSLPLVATNILSRVLRAMDTHADSEPFLWHACMFLETALVNAEPTRESCRSFFYHAGGIGRVLMAMRRFPGSSLFTPARKIVFRAGESQLGRCAIFSSGHGREILAWRPAHASPMDKGFLSTLQDHAPSSAVEMALVDVCLVDVYGAPDVMEGKLEEALYALRVRVEETEPSVATRFDLAVYVSVLMSKHHSLPCVQDEGCNLLAALMATPWVFPNDSVDIQPTLVAVIGAVLGAPRTPSEPFVIYDAAFGALPNILKQFPDSRRWWPAGLPSRATVLQDVLAFANEAAAFPPLSLPAASLRAAVTALQQTP